MCCDKYTNWGVLYLYNELDAGDKQKYEAHLEICPRCREEFSQLQNGQKFSRALPLEAIEPVSVSDLLPPVKSRVSFFEKYRRLFRHVIHAAFQNKSRLILVPAAMAVLLLILQYNLSPQVETALEWDTGFEDSLEQLDQRIARLHSENLAIDVDLSVESPGYSMTDSSPDQKLSQLETEIQSLSNDLAHLNF